jgi:hypothetical protein
MYIYIRKYLYLLNLTGCCQIIDVSVHIYIYIYIHTCIHMFIYMYVYIHIYICIYICIYIHKYVHFLNFPGYCQIIDVSTFKLLIVDINMLK